MYSYLLSKLPALLVHGLYALWYALLLILVYYFMDRHSVDFYYLHR